MRIDGKYEDHAGLFLFFRDGPDRHTAGFSADELPLLIS
jgi:hypothetical protein